MRHTFGTMAAVHGHFLAKDVGELAGVSGTTIGQWARWGYIRASVSAGEPHVYSVEDLAEATIVGELLSRGVSHADVRRAIERLRGEYGDWPLSEAPLGTATHHERTRMAADDRPSGDRGGAAAAPAGHGARIGEGVRGRQGCDTCRVAAGLVAFRVERGRYSHDASRPDLTVVHLRNAGSARSRRAGDRGCRQRRDARRQRDTRQLRQPGR
jgi:DNA-binding transcriptional MerR regulator